MNIFPNFYYDPKFVKKEWTPEPLHIEIDPIPIEKNTEEKELEKKVIIIEIL